MFNRALELTKNINSCRCQIDSALVIYKGDDLKYISTAVCIVDLLSVDELKRYTNLGHKSEILNASVENVIVRDKVKEILGYPGYKIDLDRSFAGSISTIAHAIYLNSKSHLSEAEYHYRLQESGITIVEQMSSIISYYMNMPYDTVIVLPINEIYKKYSILVKSFPTQVTDPFYVPPEEE